MSRVRLLGFTKCCVVEIKCHRAVRVAHREHEALRANGVCILVNEGLAASVQVGELQTD